MLTNTKSEYIRSGQHGWEHQKKKMNMKIRRERNRQPRKRQDVRREDDNSKRKTKNINTELRANSLGPEPSLPFFVYFLCLYFLCWENEKLFPLKNKAFLLIFECLPFVIPFVLPSLSHFPLHTHTLSLYISLSLSLSLSFSLVILWFSS